MKCIFEIKKEDVLAAGQWEGSQCKVLDFSDHLAIWFSSVEQVDALAKRLQAFADQVAINNKP